MIVTAATIVGLFSDNKFSHLRMQWWMASRSRLTTDGRTPFVWSLEEGEFIRLRCAQPWPCGEVCVGPQTPLLRSDETMVLAQDVRKGMTLARTLGGDFVVDSAARLSGRVILISDLEAVGYLKVVASGEQKDSTGHRGADQMGGQETVVGAGGAAVFGVGVPAGKRAPNRRTVRGNGDHVGVALLPESLAERRQRGDLGFD